MKRRLTLASTLDLRGSAHKLRCVAPTTSLHVSASLVLLLLLASGRTAEAAVHFVDLNSTNSEPPYRTWATAATNIQDALDVAAPGEQVLVSDGVYRSGSRAVPNKEGWISRLVVTNGVFIQSVNGPQASVIDAAGSMGCVFLSQGAVLSGFTLTNAYPPRVGQFGGGAWCESTNVLLTNCVVTGNTAGEGGGVYGGRLSYCTLTDNSSTFGGGGVAQSALENCTLMRNRGGAGGGGAFQSILVDCTLTDNASDAGGGAAGCTLDRCTLTGNVGGQAGAGGAYYCTLNDCRLVGNWADGRGGGGGASSSVLNNCTLIKNWAEPLGFGGGGAIDCTLNNCVLTSNSGLNGGGAVGGTLNNCTLVGNSAQYSGGGAFSATLNNCIVYDNTAPDGNYDTNSLLSYCCTIPLPPGAGNFTNAPLFVAPAQGNLQLQSNSPCINAGYNPYVTISTDLAGNPRVQGGTVDVGAYEFQNPASIISYAWLQQHGLPTDGSADLVDLDRDGLNNWQEWLAGTDPTDPSSVLRMLSPSTSSPGILLTWQSVTGKTYYLQRSTDLCLSPAFLSIQSNIIGQAGTTTFADPNATGPGPYFYRVGVQQ